MSTISWANGKSGKWTDGADWSGGQVPGAGDTAIIDATGAYSVKLSKVVAVGGLVLDDSRAKLVLSGSLTSPDIQLEAGLLELDKGSLSGTVTDGLGTLETAGTGTLASVTWQGNLRDTGSGTLTILDGLTLADASGAGTGTASFTGPVLLDGVAELNNASITFADSRRGDGPVAISNAPTFTIGAQAAISNMFFSVATGDQTFVNDGLVTGGSLGAGGGGGDLTLTNNGTLLDGSYNATELTNNGTLQNDNGTFLSLTNNGVIDLGTKNALTVFYGQVGAAGANAQINLDSGSLIIAGTLTTAELTAFYAAQHVSLAGSYGFGIDGVLDNSGATLNIGTDSTFGTLNGGTVNGGTVIDPGDEDNGAINLVNVSFQATKASVIFFSSLSETNSVFTGTSDINFNQSIFDGGTLANVGLITAVYGAAVLNGVDITGVNNSGSVTLVNQGLGSGNSFEITPNQNVTGYTLDGNSGTFLLDGGDDFTNATINLGGDILVGKAASTTATLAASVQVNVTSSAGFYAAVAGGELISQATITVSGNPGYLDIGRPTIDNFPTADFDMVNQGVIAISGDSQLVVDPRYGTLINSGTITIAGAGSTFEVTGNNLINSGTIEFSTGTTLELAGAVTVPELTADAGFAINADIVMAGTLDLGGSTVTLGIGGVPVFNVASGGAVTDGTLAVKAGTDFGVAGGTISAALANAGTVQLSGSAALISGAISGKGTIAIGVHQSGGALGNMVGGGQTIAFVSSDDQLTLSGSAITRFGGTLAGFAVGDSIALTSETLKSAAFSGDSLVVTLTTGATISYATNTALSGSLSINGDVISYKSSSPSIGDWTDVTHAEVPHAMGLDMSAYALFGSHVGQDQGVFDLSFLHHSAQAG